MSVVAVQTLLWVCLLTTPSFANDAPTSHGAEELEKNYTCHYTEKAGHIECEISPGNWKAYENPEEEVLDISDPIFWVDLGIVICLTCTAGLMSGLTIGLMGLDKTQMEILRKSGTPSERQQAKRILPLINRHHLLLVTLLLMNALANEALPIFLEHLVAPVYAVMVGVTLLLVFGEIIPMALFTKWGLAMGASVFWVVWILIALCFIIAWPISKLLDWILGAHEHIKLFRRSELKELMNLHGAGAALEGSDDDALCQDEVTIIKGALDLNHKTVVNIGTPLKKAFMLSITGHLDQQTLKKIVESGRSRIPVFREVRETIVGVILVKSLLLLDKHTPIPISRLEIQRLPTVASNIALIDMLNIFQTGRSHMAVIVDAVDQMTALGIVTLEDVIEELLQEEIMDETDQAVPRKQAKNESDDSSDNKADQLFNDDDDDETIPVPTLPFNGKGKTEITDIISPSLHSVLDAMPSLDDGDTQHINLESSESESEELLKDSK